MSTGSPSTASHRSGRPAWRKTTFSSSSKQYSLKDCISKPAACIAAYKSRIRSPHARSERFFSNHIHSSLDERRRGTQERLGARSLLFRARVHSGPPHKRGETKPVSNRRKLRRAACSSNRLAPTVPWDRAPLLRAPASRRKYRLQSGSAVAIRKSA